MEVSSLDPSFSGNLDCFCQEKKGVVAVAVAVEYAAVAAVEYAAAEDDAVVVDGWAWWHGAAVVEDGVAVVDGGVGKDDVAVAEEHGVVVAEEHDVVVAEDEVVEGDDVVDVGDGVAVVAEKDAWAAELLVGASSFLNLDRAAYCNCFHDELGEGVYYDEQDTHFASSSWFLSEKMSCCWE